MLATKLSLWRNNCNLSVTSLEDMVKKAQGVLGRNEVSQAENSEGFVRHLTENQTRLYGYVFSLLGDHARAADVVQETNLVLWRKIDEFQPEKPFLPWAYAIARFQVLAHLRDKSRDRLLLDEELAEVMSVSLHHPPMTDPMDRTVRQFGLGNHLSDQFLHALTTERD